MEEDIPAILVEYVPNQELLGLFLRTVFLRLSISFLSKFEAHWKTMNDHFNYPNRVHVPSEPVNHYTAIVHSCTSCYYLSSVHVFLVVFFGLGLGLANAGVKQEETQGQTGGRNSSIDNNGKEGFFAENIKTTP